MKDNEPTILLSQQQVKLLKKIPSAKLNPVLIKLEPINKNGHLSSKYHLNVHLSEIEEFLELFTDLLCEYGVTDGEINEIGVAMESIIDELYSLKLKFRHV